MTQPIPFPEPGVVPGACEPAFLDCERLDCYRVAVEFQVLAASIGSGRRMGSLRDQLDRGSVSIVLNIAEGGATSEGWRIEREAAPPGQEPEAP